MGLAPAGAAGIAPPPPCGLAAGILLPDHRPLIAFLLQVIFHSHALRGAPPAGVIDTVASAWSPFISRFVIETVMALGMSKPFEVR